MTEKFNVKWEVDDGYVGGSSPQSFDLHCFDIDADDEDTDLEEAFDDLLQEEFNQRARPVASNREEALEWMRQVRDKKKSDNRNE